MSVSLKKFEDAGLELWKVESELKLFRRDTASMQRVQKVVESQLHMMK